MLPSCTVLSWCWMDDQNYQIYTQSVNQQTCSVGTDHGYGYGYGYEAMGMGTGTGTRPWVWVRVRVQDHGYGYGYGYDMRQSHGYGSGYGYETIDMGMGTGTGPWVRVPWVRVWVRVHDVKSRMKDCGWNFNSYATLYLGTCIGTGTTFWFIWDLEFWWDHIVWLGHVRLFHPYPCYYTTSLPYYSHIPPVHKYSVTAWNVSYARMRGIYR